MAKQQHPNRKSFSDISPFSDTHPVVRAQDIEGLSVLVVGARGPYQSKRFESEFCVLTLALADDSQSWPEMTPDQRDRYDRDWEDDGLRDLFLSYVGQRKTIVELFADDPELVLGPGKLVKKDVGSVSDMWLFVDDGE